MLVIQPIGGPDDWRALFHEAGHTEHYAHTSADLPFEHRRRGDDAVTEGWALLFEGMISTPAWLTRLARRGRGTRVRLGGCGAEALLTCAATRAKLLYELELHAATDSPGCRRATSSCCSAGRL